MVKSILLTGSTGFLGSVIYRELKKQFKVITMGRNNQCDYFVDFSLWEGNLHLSDSVDAIVHVAGLAHNKAKHDKEISQVNTDSVRKLLKVATENSINQFIFISSVAVYGRDFGESIAESESLRPNTAYGRSKRDGEQLISKWARDQSRSYLNLRLPLIIGSNPPGNLGKLISSINSGKHIFLKGNSAKKSVVYATDVALFISRELSESLIRSDSINLCNERAPSFNEIEVRIKNWLALPSRLEIPIGFVWQLINASRRNIPISLPVIGKLFYSLTFSDELAREKYGYVSKELNQTTLEDELNSNP